ncbi:MAG: M20 family metallopeptidase [Bacillota bacterium]|nr:M20 family metallopeptidase [Bacillota bacterium]
MPGSSGLLNGYASEYDSLLLRHATALIGLDSSNPPGDENAVADYCADAMASIGLNVQKMRLDGGYRNVIGISSGGKAPDIALCGHIDTVPAAGGWTRPPFAATTEGGLLFGRGSADMKGALAAMLTAAKFARDKGFGYDRGFALVFTGDEENCCRGAEELIKDTAFKPRAAVIGEPTRLEVHTGSRGYSKYIIHSEGVGCHAACPEEGENAIFKMARALTRLESYSQTAAGRMHPELGAASFNVGTIKGGTNVNVVPDSCEADAEYRLLPGESAEDIASELGALAGEDAKVRIVQSYPGAYTEKGHPFVLSVCAAVEQVLGKMAKTGAFPAFSEAGFFAKGWGAPTVLLGPGSIEMAHKADECIPVKELLAAAKIYALMLCQQPLI